MQKLLRYKSINTIKTHTQNKSGKKITLGELISVIDVFKKHIVFDNVEKKVIQPNATKNSK